MNSISESVIYIVAMTVVPNTVEQAINAARVEQLKGGLYLDPTRLTVEKLQKAVEKVLADASMENGISQIRKSFLESGGVERAADAIQAFKKRHALI